MCDTPVLFEVAWLVVTLLCLKTIVSVLREVLSRGVLLPHSNIQLVVPDYMTY